MVRNLVSKAQSLFSFEGRLPRRAFWQSLYGLAIAWGLLRLAIEAATGHLSGGGEATVVTALFLLWPQAAVFVKRGRARERSVRYTLAILSCSIGGLAAIVIGRALGQFGVSLMGAVVWAGALLFLIGDYSARDSALPQRDDALPGSGVSA